MTPDSIRRNLAGEAPPEETLTFLSGEFIPEVIRRLNEPGTRRRMALYGGDRIPENERNLTDVRNRMSLLIEYKLAWVGNDVLCDHGVDEIFWTNVVANRFPDLEVRKVNGERGIRVEVKCLEAIAEEKSANFDTLKKDLNPNTDYIVVFVWEWFRDQAAVAWNRAPKVLRGFVFHASSLAELRDYNWLSNPPNELGKGFQGYDLRYAVNCRNDVYSEEEGNYGKLLRIWNNDLTYEPGSNPLLDTTIQEYRQFEDFTVWSGFKVLSSDLLTRTGSTDFTPIVVPERGKVGYRNGKIGILFKRRAGPAREQHRIAQESGLGRVIVMTDKYQWSDFEVKATSLGRLADGRKPKHLVTHLSKS
jgi:hypothetical protein